MPDEPMSPISAEPPQHQACMTIHGDNLAVRDGLGALMAMAPVQDLAPDIRGTLEIVLAEALNNVVEHAYAEAPGPIRVCVDHMPPVLKVSVYDTGLPMPQGQLPKGDLAPFAAGDDLPEGGFGWFLIRTLTVELAYERLGEVNHLHFEVQT